jgi:hypothetical protein
VILPARCQTGPSPAVAEITKAAHRLRTSSGAIAVATCVALPLARDRSTPADSPAECRIHAKAAVLGSGDAGRPRRRRSARLVEGAPSRRGSRRLWPERGAGGPAANAPISRRSGSDPGYSPWAMSASSWRASVSSRRSASACSRGRGAQALVELLGLVQPARAQLELELAALLVGGVEQRRRSCSMRAYTSRSRRALSTTVAADTATAPFRAG